MPELPEVETVRRGLEPAMLGARIIRVEQNRADLRFPFPEGFARRLEARTITALRRRAKYILIELDDGSVLLSHLGMSGSWRIEAGERAQPGRFHHPRSKDATHDHVVLHVAGPAGTTRVIYNDPRRFGFMDLARADMLERHKLLATLGVEPTGNVLNAEYLAERLGGKRTSIKAALLDQRIIAGLGNIYVCESLWRARISPRRKAHTLVDRRGRPVARLETLTLSIRNVIADAITAGGSSLRDHRQADGSLGYFQHSFDVYDRAGQPCRRKGCEGTIRRIVQTGRSTFHCPSCQT